MVLVLPFETRQNKSFWCLTFLKPAPSKQSWGVTWQRHSSASGKGQVAPDHWWEVTRMCSAWAIITLVFHLLSYYVSYTDLVTLCLKFDVVNAIFKKPYHPTVNSLHSKNTKPGTLYWSSYLPPKCISYISRSFRSMMEGRVQTGDFNSHFGHI